jgi:hypothetical protein
MEGELLPPVAADLQTGGGDFAALVPEEIRALQDFGARRGRGGSGSAELAPSLQAKMFESYLQGSTLREIQALYPHFTLGQVVYAAVSGQWHQRRLEYLDHLLNGVRDRVQQVVAEGAVFLADVLSAAHRTHGPGAKRGEAGSFEVGSMRQYKEVAEMLLRMTGQDKVQRVVGEIRHTHGTVPVAPRGASLAELAKAKKSAEPRPRRAAVEE